jgi:hypothetical protein
MKTPDEILNFEESANYQDKLVVPETKPEVLVQLENLVRRNPHLLTGENMAAPEVFDGHEFFPEKLLTAPQFVNLIDQPVSLDDGTSWKIFHPGYPLTAENVDVLLDAQKLHPENVTLLVPNDVTLDDINEDPNFFVDENNTRCVFITRRLKIIPVTKPILHKIKPKYMRFDRSTDGNLKLYTSVSRPVPFLPPSLFKDRIELQKKRQTQKATQQAQAAATMASTDDFSMMEESFLNQMIEEAKKKVDESKPTPIAEPKPKPAAESDSDDQPKKKPAPKKKADEDKPKKKPAPKADSDEDKPKKKPAPKADSDEDKPKKKAAPKADEDKPKKKAAPKADEDKPKKKAAPKKEATDEKPKKKPAPKPDSDEDKPKKKAAPKKEAEDEKPKKKKKPAPKEADSSSDEAEDKEVVIGSSDDEKSKKKNTKSDEIDVYSLIPNNNSENGDSSKKRKTGDDGEKKAPAKKKAATPKVKAWPLKDLKVYLRDKLIQQSKDWSERVRRGELVIQDPLTSDNAKTRQEAEELLATLPLWFAHYFDMNKIAKANKHPLDGIPHPDNWAATNFNGLRSTHANVMIRMIYCHWHKYFDIPHHTDSPAPTSTDADDMSF